MPPGFVEELPLQEIEWVNSGPFGVWKTVGGGAGLVMPAKAGIQAQMEASWAASYTISP